MARLTPLGWTCIGGDSITSSSHLARTYFTDSRLVEATQRFWKVEEVEYNSKILMTPEDNNVL